MSTTTEIARTHGHTGPVVCHGCGTTDLLHFIVWGNPETGEGGDLIECCACGTKAGDPDDVHADCEPDEIDEEPAEDDDEGREVRVFRRDAGWVMPDFTDLADCTTNFHRERDGRPACTDAAVWKVVELADLGASIGFYCDADLPDEHKPHPAV